MAHGTTGASVRPLCDLSAFRASSMPWHLLVGPVDGMCMHAICVPKFCVNVTLVNGADGFEPARRTDDLSAIQFDGLKREY